MSKGRHQAISVLGGMILSSASVLLSVSGLSGQEILLKYKATVVEETEDYIIIKFQKRDIGLVTQREAPLRGSIPPLTQDKLNSDEGGQERSLSKAELKKEILQELRGEIQKEVNKGIGPIDFGSVKGRVVRRGMGVPGVKVKIVRLLQGSSLLGVFKEFKKGAEFETTTDRDGRYAFQEVPVGSYQFKWLPRGSDAWIRRLTDKPDVIVIKGKTATIKKVELSKPVLP
ncbi:MAG: carboxypeptidase-like regulatory domain-containing protein [Candidatus Binatia bacterium]